MNTDNVFKRGNETATVEKVEYEKFNYKRGLGWMLVDNTGRWMLSTCYAKGNGLSKAVLLKDIKELGWEKLL